MRYGFNHPDKEKVYNKLMKDGTRKASFDYTDNGNNVSVGIVRNNDKVWLIHTENGKILEIFDL